MQLLLTDPWNCVSLHLKELVKREERCCTCMLQVVNPFANTDKPSQPKHHLSQPVHMVVVKIKQ